MSKENGRLREFADRIQATEEIRNILEMKNHPGTGWFYL